MSHILTEKGEEARTKCTIVLGLDSNNVKALFRRGCAFLLMVCVCVCVCVCLCMYVCVCAYVRKRVREKWTESVCMCLGQQ